MAAAAAAATTSWGGQLPKAADRLIASKRIRDNCPERVVHKNKKDLPHHTEVGESRHESCSANNIACAHAVNGCTCVRILSVLESDLNPTGKISGCAPFNGALQGR